jgi:excisionase family DNA binding protein
MTVYEVAARLNVSHMSVSKAIRFGRLKARKILQGRQGHIYEIEERDVMALEAEIRAGIPITRPPITRHQPPVIAATNVHPAFYKTPDIVDETRKRKLLFASVKRGRVGAKQTLRTDYNLLRWYRPECGELLEVSA